MPRAFVGIGSNIEPETNVAEALRLLKLRVRLMGLSDIYLNEPQGCAGQPAFYNAAVLIETDLSPKTLKWSVLREIEKHLGRVRNEDKYAPRTIDLDLLIYNEMVISTDTLTLPDPLITERAFLAVPLYELEPDLVVPGSGVALKDVAEKFRNHGMMRQREYAERLRKELLSGLR